MAGASPAAHGVFAVNHLRLVLGSTAHKVIHLADRPVLVVR